MKKHLFLIGLVALAVSSVTYADTAQTQSQDQSNGGGIIALLTSINMAVTTTENNLVNAFATFNTDLTNYSNYVNHLVNATVTTSLQLMFTTSPDLTQRIATNYSVSLGEPTMQNDAQDNTNQMLARIFTNTSHNTDALSQINILSQGIPSPSDTSKNTNLNGQKQINTNPFNLDSLLSPVAYTKDQQGLADAFVNYLSYQSAPFVNLPEAYLNKNFASIHAYRAYLGTYAALQSIGASNLNQLYQQRVPIKGLGKLAGLSTNDASIQQIEQYNVSQHALSPSWYAQMEVAPPATIQRESLYTLASIQLELYQNNLLLQRVLATQSAMELTQTEDVVKPKLFKLQQAAANEVNQNAKTQLQLHIENENHSAAQVQ